nr:hypothetical protein [Solanum melongena]
MKESQPIPEIAVSLATSLVAAPYLLIRNYYHKKVAPISKGAYALHDFLMLWGLEDGISLPTLVSELKNFLLSPIPLVNNQRNLDFFTTRTGKFSLSFFWGEQSKNEPNQVSCNF